MTDVDFGKARIGFMKDREPSAEARVPLLGPQRFLPDDSPKVCNIPKLAGYHEELNKNTESNPEKKRISGRATPVPPFSGHRDHQSLLSACRLRRM